MRWTSLVLVVSVLSAGCYAYAPVQPGVPKREKLIRIHLNEPSSFTIDGATYHMIGQVEGEVISWAEDRLALSATWLKSVSGQEFPGNMRTIVVPRDRLGLVEERRLSALRTAGVLSAGALLSAAITWALPVARGSGSEGGGGGSAK